MSIGNQKQTQAPGVGLANNEAHAAFVIHCVLSLYSN